MRIFVLCLAVIGFSLASPAQAISKKELEAQNAALAARIKVLEDRMLTGDPAAERLTQRMNGLENTIRTLTGEVERLKYQRDNLKATVDALEGDIRSMQNLSSRMTIHLDAVDLVAREQSLQQNGLFDPSTLEGGQEGAGQPSSVPSAPVSKNVTIPVQEDFARIEALPAKGQQKLAEGDFLGAQNMFKEYLDLNPDAPNAGEVGYWLGETYFVRGSYADAAEAYISSLRKAPRGGKAPSAMIQLAAATQKLGNRSEACQILESFPLEYPNASASVKNKAQVVKVRSGC